MSTQKNIKMTPAGMLALKNIRILPQERDFLEQFVRQSGQTLPEDAVSGDPELFAQLKQKGWLRETAVAPVSVEKPAVSVPESASVVASAPTVSTPVPEPVSSANDTQDKQITAPMAVSEEEKERSYENFMKVMGSK